MLGDVKTFQNDNSTEITKSIRHSLTNMSVNKYIITLATFLPKNEFVLVFSIINYGV